MHNQSGLQSQEDWHLESGEELGGSGQSLASKAPDIVRPFGPFRAVHHGRGGKETEPATRHFPPSQAPLDRRTQEHSAQNHMPDGEYQTLSVNRADHGQPLNLHTCPVHLNCPFTNEVRPCASQEHGSALWKRGQGSLKARQRGRTEGRLSHPASNLLAASGARGGSLHFSKPRIPATVTGLDYRIPEGLSGLKILSPAT